MLITTVARRVARAGCLLFAGVALLALGSAATYSEYDAPIAQQVVRHGAAGEPFEFVAYGDIEDELQGFEDVVRAVHTKSKPDFGVVLGDVAKRSARARESYIEYFDALRELRPDYPIFTVPGNHDRPDDGGTDEYARAFGRLNWWFEHEGCVFIGLDDAEGPLTDAAHATLAEAAQSAQSARRVFVFLHVPVFGEAVEPGARPERSRQAAANALAGLRDGLGVPVDVVIAAHGERWSFETDDLGTMHVCCGAEPGLGWPEKSTPQIAAIIRVSDDDVSVAPVRVPYRTEVLASLRQGTHLYVYQRLRRWLAPIPVWLAAVLALVVWMLLQPRRRRTHAAPGVVAEAARRSKNQPHELVPAREGARLTP